MSTRKNIIQPAAWWEAFHAAADAKNQSLSEWLGNQALAGLPDKVRKSLPERDGVGRPKNQPEQGIQA